MRIGGEDHNSADRENDEHREPRVRSVVCFSHYAGPKKSPTADRYGTVGRGMRHAGTKDHIRAWSVAEINNSTILGYGYIRNATYVIRGG
jgi:hypothetical protein